MNELHKAVVNVSLHRLDLVSLSLFSLVARSGGISKGDRLLETHRPAAGQSYCALELARWAQIVKAGKIEAD